MATTKKVIGTITRVNANETVGLYYGSDGHGKPTSFSAPNVSDLRTWFRGRMSPECIIEFDDPDGNVYLVK